MNQCDRKKEEWKGGLKHTLAYTAAQKAGAN